MFCAWREFKKNKSNKPDVIAFPLNLENNIFALRDKLNHGNWVCDGYKEFRIKDPKPRIIHKATVRDRVMYQAMYRVLYPIFDKTFIFDSYSSRKGKGTYAGIDRLRILLRKLSRNYTTPAYALKCDIKKFFDSIDHSIILDLLGREIDCCETMELIEKIINSFHKTPGKGLPLGNVTSQIFANVYMNPFDWYVGEELGMKSYIRYCDDFIILSRDKDELARLIPLLEKFLNNSLKLELHPDKVLIRKFHQGIDFLGSVLLPHRTVVRTKTKKRIVKKSKMLAHLVKVGQISSKRAGQSLDSYLGHLSHTGSREVRSAILKAKAQIVALSSRL